jgi:hypothetical protein
LFSIQLKEERSTLLALLFVEMPHEFPDVGIAEFPARIQVRRAAQNCQDFFGQIVISLFVWHSLFCLSVS